MRGLNTSIGVVILFILVFLVLLNYINVSIKENFVEYNNTLPISSHMEFSKKRSLETNPIMSLINQMSPIVPPSENLQKSSIQALNTDNVDSNGLPGEFQVEKPEQPLQLNPKDMDLAAKARFCQEYTTSADCKGWDPPVRNYLESDYSYQERYNRWVKFTEECGLSLDLKGTNFQGNAHQGGLFVGKENKLAQLEAAVGKPNKEKYYRPTLGTSKKGLFSLNKDSCLIIEERLKCSTQKNFDIRNCSQCYIQDKWDRIDDDSQRLVPEFYVGGSGKLEVIVQQGKSNTFELTKEVKLLQGLPSFEEGSTLLFNLSGGGGNPIIYGYLASITKKVKPFRFELAPLIEVDKVSGLRPAIRGFLNQNDIKMNRIVAATGKNELKLIVKVPFTFLDTEDDACVECDNSPFLTKKSSAEFLNSNPCFGPNAKPGNYNMECLKEKFLAAGGTQEGKGFPKNTQTLAGLNYDKRGRPRDLPQIGEYLYELSVRSSTGRSGRGTKLSVDDWNEASMFMIGKPIKNVCDGQENIAAKNISSECLQYVYRNQGEGGEFGSTYTAGFTLSSLIGKSADEKGAAHCHPKAPLDPSTDTGKKAIENLPNLAAVKKLYNDTHTKANNNEFSIYERSKEIKECYNVDIAKPPIKEVYWVGPGYDYTFEQATKVAKELGGELATYQQLYAAWALGANWCSTGWVSEGSAHYPINGQLIFGCASYPGVQFYQPERAGATVYGIKPGKDSEEAVKYKIHPFNTQTGQWNSEEVFPVFDGGYDKTKDQAAQVCADVGATNATFNQLEQTHRAGGQWCAAAWVSDSNRNNGFYPMQQMHGWCGSVIGNISEYGASYAPKDSEGKPMFGVNCYGVKPNKDSPMKQNRKIGNFYSDAWDSPNTVYSSYDYYKIYRPIPVKNVGLVHPYYFPTFGKFPVKVQVFSVNIPNGRWYTTDKKLGLFEMVPSVAERFTFILTPARGNQWSKCSASGFTKKPVGQGNQSEAACNAAGKCYNPKNGGFPCYEPGVGENAVFIQSTNGFRVCAEEDGTINVNRTWDGPWESWYLEPVQDNPPYVAIRSHHLKYMSHNGLFKMFDAKANAVGANEMFMLRAVETYPPMT
ncbi:MAG: hypothetical protein EBT86_02410 [Actinobacteria bacterium]|nr:hypothetical protein [Actinomycetota bacterium]